MTWVAVPESSELFRECRSGLFSDELASIPAIYAGTGRFEKGEPLADRVSEVLRDRPALARRTHRETHRSWDAIHYLISDRRRNPPRAWAPPSAIADFVIEGEAQISPNQKDFSLESGRFLSAAVVREAAVFLEPFTEAHFFAHWDPLRMEETGVYKFFADRAEAARMGIWEDFRTLREMMTKTASESDEAIFVFRN